MINLFDRCPACGGTITVTECRCANCQLEMRGEFRTGQFATLSDDQLTFIRVFLRARGNLSEVEKVLGVSYPTIRNKLEEINRALDRSEAGPDQERSKATTVPVTSQTPASGARQAILQQVAAGEISAAEALDGLRATKGGK